MARKKVSKTRTRAKPAVVKGVSSPTRHAKSPSPTVEQLSDAELAASIAMDRARVNAIGGTLASDLSPQTQRRLATIHNTYSGAPNSEWTAKTIFLVLFMIVVIGIVAAPIGWVGWKIIEVAWMVIGHKQAEAGRRDTKDHSAETTRGTPEYASKKTEEQNALRQKALDEWDQEVDRYKQSQRKLPPGKRDRTSSGANHPNEAEADAMTQRLERRQAERDRRNSESIRQKNRELEQLTR